MHSKVGNTRNHIRTDCVGSHEDNFVITFKILEKLSAEHSSFSFSVTLSTRLIFLSLKLTLFYCCAQFTSITTIFNSLVEKSQLASDNNNHYHEETEDVSNDCNQQIKCTNNVKALLTSKHLCHRMPIRIVYLNSTVRRCGFNHETFEPIAVPRKFNLYTC